MANKKNNKKSNKKNNNKKVNNNVKNKKKNTVKKQSVNKNAVKKEVVKTVNKKDTKKKEEIKEQVQLVEKKNNKIVSIIIIILLVLLSLLIGYKIITDPLVKVNYNELYDHNVIEERPVENYNVNIYKIINENEVLKTVLDKKIKLKSGDLIKGVIEEEIKNIYLYDDSVEEILKKYNDEVSKYNNCLKKAKNKKAKKKCKITYNYENDLKNIIEPIKNDINILIK